MRDLAVVLVGLILAGVGGEMLVRSAVGLASWARVPARVVATTVAAFATSSPEFAVSTSSAVAGTPAVGLGDAVGSNVANVGLVLGIVFALSEIRIRRETAVRDIGVAFIAPLLTGVLLLDGLVSRRDGALLLVVFAGWLVFTARDAMRERRALPARGVRPAGSLIVGSVGVVALLLAGRFVASGAQGIGDALGLDFFVVGATMVAIGTSLPELATALSATVRGHHEIGLATILGSNIFNGLWIIGVTALIEPIPVDRTEALIALGFGVSLVALLYPGREGRFRRRRGWLLLAVYVVYLAVLALTGATP